MPRRARIEIAGGTYYLLQASSKHQPLFESELDYRYLESLVASAVQRSRTQVLSFCWLPHELHLAVRSSDLPVSRFMQGFTARYAQHLHRRTGEIGHLFPQSFQSLLIDPDAWLPELVRHIHHLPVQAGLTARATHYPHSSIGAFLGIRPIAWLSTKAVLKTLQARGMNLTTARAYLQSTPLPEESALFSSKPLARTRILGDSRFIQSLPRRHRHTSPRLTLTQLTEVVARSQDVAKTEIFSTSRRREVALARSLIAWHAMQRRIASLAQVSVHLGRDPSTLSKAIIRHRHQHPRLFRLDALGHLLPLA